MTETIYSKSPTNSIASAHISAKLFLLLVIVLFIAARLWRLTSSCLWFDEIFSVHAAEHSWRGLLPFVAADLVHPPLFYILLKLWIGIGGESTLWLRLFPALASVLAIWPILLLVRELDLNSSETTFALLLLAVNGYLIKYAQEVRMYSLLFFLSACSLWLFFSLSRINDGRQARLLALTVVNLLLIYTHYYGWLLVGLQAALGFWFVPKLRKQLLLSFALLLGSYVPWIILLTRSYQSQSLAQNIGWIPRPGLRALAQYSMLLNQPFVFPESSADNATNPFGVMLVLVLFAIPIIMIVWRSRKDGSERPNRVLWLAAFAFAPVVLVAGASWILRNSIWGTRHFIIASVPYCVLAAVAIVRLPAYWARIAIFLVAGCWFSATAVYVLIKPAPRFVWCAWTPLVQRAAQTDGSPAIKIYAFEDLIAYHLWFATRDSTQRDFHVTVIKGMAGIREDAAYFLPRDFKEVAVGDPALMTENEIWIAFRGSHFDQTQPPLDRLMRAGYHIDRLLSEKTQYQDAFLVKLRK